MNLLAFDNFFLERSTNYRGKKITDCALLKTFSSFPRFRAYALHCCATPSASFQSGLGFIVTQLQIFKTVILNLIQDLICTLYCLNSPPEKPTNSTKKNNRLCRKLLARLLPTSPTHVSKYYVRRL